MQHVQKWDPKVGIGLTGEQIEKLVGALGLRRIWPEVAAARETQDERLELKHDLLLRLEEKVKAMEGKKANVIRREEGSLLSREQEKKAPPVRSADSRAISEIPLVEIAACVVGVLEQTPGLERDGVLDAVAREFGYKRTTRQVADAIDKAIDMLITDRVVVEVGGELRLTDKAVWPEPWRFL